MASGTRASSQEDTASTRTRGPSYAAAAAGGAPAPEPPMATEPLPIRSSAPTIDHRQGFGLGRVSDDVFEPSRWYPSAPVLCEQYTKFVNAMLGRIRANESNAHEVRLFFELLRVEDGEPGYWRPVNGFLPALEDGIPAATNDRNEPYLLLVTLLRLEMRDRKRGSRARSDGSGVVAARTGLDQREQVGVAAQIFGKESTGSSRTVDQNRFLKSWFEMGYPPGGENATF
ncbi:MAG: hypothetical protein Q9191_005139 [Dirinaria sp. TL-2023a]